jgi:hypothetical protein
MHLDHFYTIFFSSGDYPVKLQWQGMRQQDGGGTNITEKVPSSEGLW